VRKDIMRRFSILVMLTLALFLVGCGDDEPVRPGPGPAPEPLATTPDSLMSLVRTALEERDLALYDDLLDPNFVMAVSAWEGNFGDLPTDHMTRGEAVTAADNMFSGQGVTNWQGESVPGVTGIIIHQWERISPWVAPAAKDGPEDVPPAPVVSSMWALRMFVERGTGYPLLAVAGTYDVTAWESSVDDQVVYTLSYMQILEGTKTFADKSETFGWAGANLLYLTNEAPLAALEVTEGPGHPWPPYAFDPVGSTDVDSGLASLPFRWASVEEPLVGPGEWSAWTDQPLLTTFTSTGPWTVTLEVRDRWGATARTSRTVEPEIAPLPFPDSPDQLMANFQTTYENRFFPWHRDLLHPDFLMILQQETVDQFPELGSTIDLNEELRIHERMYSGENLTDPNGAFVPGMKSISFGTFRPLDDWQLSPANDPIPDALFAPYEVNFLFNRGPQYSQISIKGQIRFYVTSRDSLYEGTVRPYYQMVGQVDLTSALGKSVEGTTFGTLKALYR